MAYRWSSTTHRLTLSSPSSPRPGTDGTVVILVKPNWSSGDSATHPLWFFKGSSSGEFSFQKFSDNKVYIGWYGAADHRVVVNDTGLFTAGTWASHIFTWTDAGDDARYYVENVEVGSRTSTVTTFSLGNISVGNYDASVGSANANADLAEFAFWSVRLDEAERKALKNGYSPILIRPTSLQAYFPLVRGVNDVRGMVLTVSGPAVADHSRVILSLRQRVILPMTGYSGFKAAWARNRNVILGARVV